MIIHQSMIDLKREYNAAGIEIKKRNRAKAAQIQRTSINQKDKMSSLNILNHSMVKKKIQTLTRKILHLCCRIIKFLRATI